MLSNRIDRKKVVVQRETKFGGLPESGLAIMSELPRCWPPHEDGFVTRPCGVASSGVKPVPDSMRPSNEKMPADGVWIGTSDSELLLAALLLVVTMVVL